ncbi:NUDIX hydrolase [Paenibacillus sp. WLX2291]|uniref:NUDIX hydrolase n=1 Tax=Paenibacillus sp. WLX2291 TaxID=3296934 RepID=UPI003984334C
MMKQELLDIYDDQDRHLGVCERSEVHRLGHWHHTFHCWLVRDTPEGRMLIFQRRHPGKDTFPDLYDITAAGHLSAGETVQQAAREIQEELGLPLTFAQLTPLFVLRDESQGETMHGMFIDREVSSVFGAFSDRELYEYTLQDDEVSGIYEARLDEMTELFAGQRDHVQARGVHNAPVMDHNDVFDISVTIADFVPHQPGYCVKTFSLLQQLTPSK